MWFFFSSRRRHTRCGRDWSSDVCSSDLVEGLEKRIATLTQELKEIETDISDRKNAQKDAQEAILQYKEKQNNVRNNREFRSEERRVGKECRSRWSRYI